MTYPVGRSRVAGALLAALVTAGCAVLIAWTLQPVATGWRQALAWGALFVAAGWSAWAWWRSPAGRLAWDGAAWRWEAPSAPAEGGTPSLALDLQTRVLLRWRAEDGRARWFWAEQDAAPADWGALRRAVYWPASEAPPAAAPPSAER